MLTLCHRPERPTTANPLAFAAIVFAAGAASGAASAQCNPAITQQPVPTIGCPVSKAVFSVAAEGTGPLTYQWQLLTVGGTWATVGNDPMPLACPGGGGGVGFAYASPIFGNPISFAVRNCPGLFGAPTHWQVRCHITSPCGATDSEAVTLTICPADFNCSGGPGGPTVQDIYDFLTAWNEQAGAASGSANFNGVGGVNVQDIYDFVSAWNAGCP